MRPPQSWDAAKVTLAITLATVAAWLMVELSGQFGWAVGNLGFLPLRIGLEDDPFSVPVWLTPLTATLVHAGFFHLLFNLLMLVVCGRAVE
ncbi:MAG TPA: rhomboid family intramembrane serine protease, partial [Allosphingosinicella sp.]